MKRLWTTGYRAYELGVFDEKNPKVAVIKEVLQKELCYQLDSTSEEFWLIFETCLTCLPAKQAKIFMMREFLELSSEEICQENQLSISNLHTTLYRARLQLQNCLSHKL